MEQNIIVDESTTSFLERSDLYINRELSWIEFNRRVFKEAKDERHPLLERVKFISIFETNLDRVYYDLSGGTQRSDRLTHGTA